VIVPRSIRFRQKKVMPRYFKKGSGCAGLRTAVAFLLTTFLLSLDCPAQALSKVYGRDHGGGEVLFYASTLDSHSGAIAPEQKSHSEIQIARRQNRGRSGNETADKGDFERRRHEWESMPPEKKEMLRQRMKRFKELPPEERSLYQERFKQWQKLSPQERERIRENLRRWERLSPEEKEKTRRWFQQR